jgi:hypothetical protein
MTMNRFGSTTNGNDASVSLPLPTPIEWIATPLALRYSPSRFQLSRYAILSSLHQWLVSASDAGCIIRQEEARLVPLSCQ